MKSGKALLFFMRLSLVGIVTLFPALFIYIYFFVFFPVQYQNAQPASELPESHACSESLYTSAMLKKGQQKQVAGISEAYGKYSYWIKTPLNYSSARQWPLLIVFSPALSGQFMERYTGLTSVMTEVGFVVAYVDSIPMSIESIVELEGLVADIEKKWCVEPSKIFLAGHSDGATISQALHLLPEVKKSFAGFISSAAGFREEDLRNYHCPEQASVFLTQNTGDTHFQNYSASAVKWWANCFSCEYEVNIFSAENANREFCFEFSNCKSGSAVSYCQQKGGHLRWPRRHQEMRKFLQDANS